MSNYKSSSLFHYTRRLNVIKSILIKGFRPCYCIEEYSYRDLGNNETQYVLGIPMVCFCDIPLSCVREHQKKYGKYAIALSKEWAIKNGLNPILYIYNKSLVEGMDQLRTNNISPSNKNIINIIHSQNKGVASHKLFGITKIAQRKDNKGNIIDYSYENEWRYILNPKNVSSFLDGAWESNEWLYGGEAELLKDENRINRRNYKELLKDCYLTFDFSDIQHIIVPDERAIIKCINLLKKLKTICGKYITEEDRAILYSKITNVERIRTDF